MVIGNGLVAKRFENYSDDDGFLIFASGVSNSKSTDQAAYDREFSLLAGAIAENRGKILAYFSTCSINDPEESGSAYVAHKKKIEQFIISNVPHYAIFRVSNLVGRSANANTVLNFIVNNIKNGTHFNLWANATRNLIDVDDFYAVADYLLKNRLFPNQIVNIANSRSYRVSDIVAAAERYLDKKGNYTSVPRGSSFNIDISDIAPLLPRLKINFDEGYLGRLLTKYYSQ